MRYGQRDRPHLRGHAPSSCTATAIIIRAMKRLASARSFGGPRAVPDRQFGRCVPRPRRLCHAHFFATVARFRIMMAAAFEEDRRNPCRVELFARRPTTFPVSSSELRPQWVVCRSASMTFPSTIAVGIVVTSGTTSEDRRSSALDVCANPRPCRVGSCAIQHVVTNAPAIA